MAKIKPKTSGLVIGDEDTEPVMSVTENTDEVENIPEVEDSMSDEPTVTMDDDISINADIIQKSPVKYVKILPRVDHTCVIGGVRYFLRKGVQQNVPLDVKNILTKADLLLPL